MIRQKIISGLTAILQVLVTPNSYFIMPVLPKEAAIMAQQWSKVNRNHFVDLLITEQDYGKTTNI
ncbi:hypothetical protein CTM83_12600 [Photobacterium leiognathi subsp. mandapamensis]|uniref:Uncharacterized protein n=1 Tax=Photobacterium leiognathi TaxID=553611 RepID=A0ABX5GGN4_PHOLE|nr:hypothetical protein UB42_05720 [Photobacterium leiognathi]PSU99374.1 hypothetical protein C0W80_12895 [Photobacterium leiognathi subsp. mandapamensis]PHZ59448.1 hypothetical protein CRG86_020140 [Photobacterium leiognathi]PSV83093.1 hypothetical protein CTM94_08635 [Photobacterium leiognathi]PSW52569.1 hypothetical protein CTM83_12600 [Photobacterium leiognathi subsp. mandapamensis]